jgi:hypothetical protein
VSPYPIVEHRSLGTVPKTLLRAPRRDLDELPTRPPGGELVAVVDGRYVTLPGQLRGNEHDLVAASSVLVVDTRPSRHVTASLELDSMEPGESFVVRVTFSCTVLDAAETANKAPEDIVPTLESHLTSDSQLMSLGRDFDVESSAQLREHVTARIKAFCLGRRPPAPGMRIDLASIEMDTPDDLRRHAAARREERRRQELDRLKDEFSFEQAKLFEELIRRGPEAVEALWLKLNDPRFSESAERSYKRRDHLHNRLMRLAELFSEGGQFDTVPLDTPKLVDAIMNTFIPPPQPGVAQTSYTLEDDERSGQLRPGAKDESAVDDTDDTDLPDEEALSG